MLSFDPTKPGGYPNGRLLTDHIVAHRLKMLSNGKIPPDGLKPHTDLLRASRTSARPTPILIRPPRKGAGGPCSGCPASRQGQPMSPVDTLDLDHLPEHLVLIGGGAAADAGAFGISGSIRGRS